MKKLLIAVLMALSINHSELNAQNFKERFNNFNNASRINDELIAKHQKSKLLHEGEKQMEHPGIPHQDFQENTSTKNAADPFIKQSITNPRHIVKPSSALMKGGMPNDPFFKFQYALTKTKINELWNIPVKNSKRPIIAFIGTGIEYDHPDLADNVWQNEEELFGEIGIDDDGNGYIDDYFGWNFADDNNNVNDNSGTDTYCAGVAAAVGNNKTGIIGANPDAIILPIKIPTNYTDANILVKAINYACDKGADIIHISTTNANITQELYELLNTVSKNTYIIAPAYSGGNPITKYYAYPASLPCVIGVEASDSTGGNYSDYDNDGRYFSSYTNNLNYDLKVPGTDILTTARQGEYDMISAPFLASSLVAGAISRLISVKDYDDTRTLITQLIDSQDDNGGITDFMATYLTNEKREGIKLSSLTITDSENIITDHTLSDGTQYEIYLGVRNFYGNNGNISIHIGFEDESDADLINIITGNDIVVDTTLNSYEYAEIPQKVIIQTKDGISTSKPIRMTFTVKSDIGSDTLYYNLNIVGQPIYDGYVFNIISEETNEAEVCRTTEDKEDIIIPNSVTYKNKNYQVTKIADYAFMNNLHARYINIPETINHIGKEAFYGCSNIYEFVLYSQVQHIDENAFTSCPSDVTIYYFIHDFSIDNVLAENLPANTYSYYYFLDSDNNYKYITQTEAFTIPEGIKTLGKSIFANCRNLGTVVLPESLESIGEKAFSNCTSLTQVQMGSNVKSINSKAFINCYNLSQISNIAKVEEIAEKAFYGCDRIQNIKLSAIKHIGASAFYSCDNLRSVETGSKLQSIGEHAFMSCNQLSTFNMSDNVETIGDSTFYDCSHLSQINLPTSLKEIKKSTFKNCASLNITKIPDNIEQIADEAFYNCGNIKSLTIGNSIKTIGNNAFYQCKNLSNLKINGQPESFGTRAFCTCSSLSSINIPNSVTSIGNEAFKNCDNLPVKNGIRYADTYLAQVISKDKTSYEIENGTRFISENAFEGCKFLTSIDLPKSVRYIGEKAFTSCEQLKSITIPEGVEIINTSTFEECTSMQDVLLPKTLHIIGDNAFYSCESIESIIIPDSVVSLGERSFCNCSNMTTVNIPEAVKSIGTRAFHYCRSLPVIDNIRYADTYLLEVSDNSLSNYDIKENTRFIANNAFAKCKKMTSISIPQTVIHIGNSAFSSCTSLDSIIINSKEPYEVDEAFISAKDRKNITLYVPTGCHDAYAESPWWNGFKDIIEFNSTDIAGISKRENKNNNTVFNLFGQKLNNTNGTHGIFIIEGKKYLK